MRTVDCSGCGATLDVSAMEPGTEFACGACGATLKVPSGAAPAHHRRREPRERPSRPSSKAPLYVGVGAAVAILVGIGAWAAMRGGGEEKASATPRPALGPGADGAAATKPPAPPPKPVDPEEAAWAAAKTEDARRAYLEERLPLSSRSDEISKGLFGFLVRKGRTDLARKAAEARLAADPESPWANETLDRKDYGPEIGALVGNRDLAEHPLPEAASLAKRLDEKRTRVPPGDDRKRVEAEIAAVRKHLETLADPWTKEMLGVVKMFREEKAFLRFQPMDHVAWPPYLVVAQRQQDSLRHSTRNVLENHSKFFQCLTGEFLRIMKEAGLSTPTVAEMGNPVLKAFVFTDRNAFERWHWDLGYPKDYLKGKRAYYMPSEFSLMFLYDTGAPSSTQDDDTCTAFHEATHQLVHHYRRYYLTLEDRRKDPAAPEVGLEDRRLHEDAIWFQEGFAEFFGAADRISSRTGEWKLFRPHRGRMAEWGDPSIRRDPQWTLPEILAARNYGQIKALGEKKWPGHDQEMLGMFYAQSWALNHFLYFGKKGKYRDRYLKVVHEEMCGRTSVEDFFRAMEAGATKEEQEDFLDTLSKGWIDHQKELLRQ